MKMKAWKPVEVLVKLNGKDGELNAWQVNRDGHLALGHTLEHALENAGLRAEQDQVDLVKSCFARM